ncbi:unnamed protein product [Arabidopsis halleri]
MKSRNIVVLLVEPPGDTAQQDTTIFPSSVDSVVDCTQVLGGGKLLSGIPPNCYSDDDNDKVTYCVYCYPIDVEEARRLADMEDDCRYADID